MKTRLLLLAAFATLTFTACDNDDDEQAVVDPQPTNTEMITSQQWMITSIVETANVGPAAERMAEMAQTSKDDIYIFKEIGEAVRDEGETKKEGDPQIVEVAPWVFMDQERVLKVDFVSLPTNDEIVEITPRRFVLRNVGPSATVVTTFEAVE